MIKLNKIYCILTLLVTVCVTACDKSDKEFRDYLEDKELIYPGVPLQIKARPGNGRVMVYWKPSPDPSIEKYVVYWNNKADSVVVPASLGIGRDSISTIIPGLFEYTYSFTVHAIDKANNRSIPLDLNNVKIYGAVYRGGLINRFPDNANPYEVQPNGDVLVRFAATDTSNVGTTITYTNNSNQQVTAFLSQFSNTVTLTNYKPSTAVTYQSAYVPANNALDTFKVNNAETFPTIYTNVLCSKSIFAALNLPYDVQPYESQTGIAKLWDGSTGPQGYPNIFHSNGNSQLPHHFTFDMGAVYNRLGVMETTGRDCCHNPTEYEVWGIANITGAETTVPGNDANWKANAIAKGWTLLSDVIRSDDGKGPYKINLMENPPPVRYIRIRVKKVASGENAYSNLSELSFWNRQ
jgi:hypothetical protein